MENPFEPIHIRPKILRIGGRPQGSTRVGAIPCMPEIGAKAVRRGRCITLQMAEVAVPKALFRKILSLIDRLPPRQAPE